LAAIQLSDCARIFLHWLLRCMATWRRRSMSHLLRSSIATCLVAAMCTIATTPGGAIAAEDFPHRTIKIIVPVPPGPLLDVVPRIVADKLSAKWNVPQSIRLDI